MQNLRPGSFDRRMLEALALPALVVTLGLQMMRVFFPSIAWYLMDTIGLPSTSLALYAFGAFVAGFLAAPVRRILGPALALRLTVLEVALFRVAEQASFDPGIDLWLSGAGTAAFLIFLPIFLSHIRALRGKRAGPVWAYGLLLGLALDSAIKGLLGTLDLSWWSGVLPFFGVLLAAALCLWLALREITPNRDAASEGGWADSIPLLAIGPLLMLQAIIFQNHGWVSEAAGVPFPLGFLILMAGNLFAVLGAAWGLARPGSFQVGVALPAAAVILAATYLADRPGGYFAFVLQANQFAVGWSLALTATVIAPTSRRGSLPSTIMLTLGMLLFLTLAFLYYVALDLALPFERRVFPLVAAALLGIGIVYTGYRVTFVGRTPWREGTATYAVVLLLLAPAITFLQLAAPPASEASGQGTVRVMTYNIHSAYNPAGGQDPEAIARAIEESGAEIVGLQEISRGWLINGSTDLVSWLSNRLRMRVVFHGTTGPVWGNAILSKHPILEYGAGGLPREGTIIVRGYLWARIETGGPQPLLVIDTHLHQIEADSEPRQRQVAALLEFWDGESYSVLLGDMNAEPGSQEMAMLEQAGFADAWAQRGEGAGHTYSSTNPFKRIDWIWHTTDLATEAVEVPSTTASDHLPVWATVR